MKKKFTAEEVIKRHETNVKAGGSLYFLAGALCAIYILRYFITKNFNFYFKLAFPDMFLKLGDSGEIGKVISVIAAIGFLLFYFLLGLLVVKKQKLYPLLAVTVAVDTLCLFFCDFVLWRMPTSTDFLIDIICHFWVLLFLVVGAVSQKKLGKN